MAPAPSEGRLLASVFSSLGSENIDQPFGFLVVLAGGLLQNAAVLINVAKVLSDLHKPGILVAGDVGAVDLRAAALAIVALKVKRTLSAVLVKWASKSALVIAVLYSLRLKLFLIR